MEEVRGVMICLFKEKNGHPRYCVLKRDHNWQGWEFPKGRIDTGEDVKEAAMREIEEETGIKPIEIDELDIEHEWTYLRDNKKYRSIYKCFMARAPEDARVYTGKNPDNEHSKGFFLNFRDTMDILEHDNQKDLLKIVDSKLKKS